MTIHGFSIFALFAATLMLTGTSRSQVFEATVDFGEDVGQNLSSIFEVRDADGRVICGAGFLGAYNTQPRSNRHRLSFFITPTDDSWEFEIQQLPRPSPDAGVYLFDYDGRLYATTRSGATDHKIRYWDESTETWIEDDEIVRYAHETTGRALALRRERLWWGDDLVFAEKPEGLRPLEPYFSNGFLLTRRLSRGDDALTNEITASRWSPGQTLKNLDSAIRIPLRSAKEFVYAWGQLGDATLAATNTGGVYRFADETWTTLVEPDRQTSFQIYTGINWRDRLLLGHYPTGELWEFDGGAEIRRLENWPPVLAGVSKRAREAQTTTIYGGQLLVGVWPWAELWRYDEAADSWHFVRRMFSQPELTDEVVHPWENETAAADPDGSRNAWGHRLTSAVPFGDSLYISTSAKTAAAFDPKFEFLTPEVRNEYGAVHRLRLPGQLAAEIDWNWGPTKLEFRIEDDAISIWQDGVECGRAKLGKRPSFGEDSKIKWGSCVFGEFRGKILLPKNSAEFEVEP
ncbi:MAG: hypothetical protein ACI8UO_003658 [Verrucomicrobiales bacterium]|jgi:hypothetical protein